MNRSEIGKDEKPRTDAMDTEESEMMNTETAMSGANPNDVVKDLLTLARQLINQGKPSQALQAENGYMSGLGFCRTLRGVVDHILPRLAWVRANIAPVFDDIKNQNIVMWCWKQVVMAMRTKGGDDAIFQSLHRARELYRSRLQANAAADQLACLFAECAIAEVEPSYSEPSPHDLLSPSIAPDSNETSILAETGRTQIVLDAFSDGSSFICLQCGGLVSNHRKEEHYAFWCCKI